MVRVALLSLAIPLGCGTGVFACSSDEQCGTEGQCEANGWCSFPDASCPDGGRRYAAHSGDGLAGLCVAGSGETGGGESSSSGSTLTATPEVSSEASTLPSDASTTSTSSTSDGEETAVQSSTTGMEVDPSLLLWLDFEDEAAPWVDGGQYGHDASCAAQACPVLEMGPVGNAARFDGIDDELQVEGDDALEQANAFTLALWISADAVGTAIYQDVLTRAWGPTFQNSWGIGFPPMLGVVRFVVHDGVTQTSVGQVQWPAEGGWHHVAGTYDGMVSRFYFDGVMISELDVVAVVYDEHPVLVGADLEIDEVVNFFGGAVDDVRIYTRALDEDEIAALP